MGPDCHKAMSNGAPECGIPNSGGRGIKINFYIFLTISDINMEGEGGLWALRIANRRSPPTHGGAVFVVTEVISHNHLREEAMRIFSMISDIYIHSLQILLEKSGERENSGGFSPLRESSHLSGSGSGPYTL